MRFYLFQPSFCIKKYEVIKKHTHIRYLFALLEETVQLHAINQSLVVVNVGGGDHHSLDFHHIPNKLQSFNHRFINILMISCHYLFFDKLFFYIYIHKVIVY